MIVVIMQHLNEYHITNVTNHFLYSCMRKSVTKCYCSLRYYSGISLEFRRIVSFQVGTQDNLNLLNALT